MPLIQKSCPSCGQPVEVDSDDPHQMMLDGARDKQRNPRALHICSGSPTSLFKAAPKQFLEKYVVVVDEHAQLDASADKAKQICRFHIEAADKNTMRLKFHAGAGEDYIEAYWLPWQSHQATSMDLGPDADFFFTSEMTNCRFSVLDANRKKPKVAHVAGDLSTPTARTRAEVQEGFRTPDGPRPRSLSISDSTHRPAKPALNLPDRPKLHSYTGQTGDPTKHSSAFVFGRRDRIGDWLFYAQVAKGSLVEGFFDNNLTEDLQILNYIRI